MSESICVGVVQASGADLIVGVLFVLPLIYLLVVDCSLGSQSILWRSPQLWQVTSLSSVEKVSQSPHSLQLRVYDLVIIVQPRFSSSTYDEICRYSHFLNPSCFLITQQVHRQSPSNVHSKLSFGMLWPHSIIMNYFYFYSSISVPCVL